MDRCDYSPLERELLAIIQYAVEYRQVKGLEETLDFHGLKWRIKSESYKACNKEKV